MGNITSGQVYTISLQTLNGEVLYVTAGFGDVTLTKLIPPNDIHQTDPTQVWRVVGNLDKAQLQSGLISNADYAINFYLTSDSGNNVFSATGDPLNATYWSITDADNGLRTYLELINHQGESIGFMQDTGSGIKLTANKQQWTFTNITEPG